MSSNFNKHANRAASVRVHCGVFFLFVFCMCVRCNNNNKRTPPPPPTYTSTSLLPTRGVCPQPSLSHAKADLKPGHIYLPSPAPASSSSSSSSSSLYLNGSLAPASAPHFIPGRPCSQLDGWMERRW